MPDSIRQVKRPTRQLQAVRFIRIELSVKVSRDPVIHRIPGSALASAAANRQRSKTARKATSPLPCPTKKGYPDRRRHGRRPAAAKDNRLPYIELISEAGIFSTRQYKTDHSVPAIEQFRIAQKSLLIDYQGGTKSAFDWR